MLLAQADRLRESGGNQDEDDAHRTTAESLTALIALLDTLLADSPISAQLQALSKALAASPTDTQQQLSQILALADSLMGKNPL